MAPWHLLQLPLAVVEPGPGSWHPFSNLLSSVFTVTPWSWTLSSLQPHTCKHSFSRDVLMSFDPTEVLQQNRGQLRAMASILPT